MLNVLSIVYITPIMSRWSLEKQEDYIMPEEKTQLAENEPRWYFKVCAYGAPAKRMVRMRLEDVIEILEDKCTDWSKVLEVHIERMF